MHHWPDAVLVLTWTGALFVGIGCAANWHQAGLRDIGSVADEYNTYITPPHWAFATMWAIISVLYTLAVLSLCTWGRARPEWLHAIRLNMIGNFCLIIGWLYSFSHRQLWTSMTIIYLLWSVLKQSHDIIWAEGPDLKSVSRRLRIRTVAIHVAVSVSFSWIGVAMLVNTTVTLMAAGLEPSEDWGISWIVLLMAWSWEVLWKHRDWAYAITTSFALFAIALRYERGSSVFGPAITASVFATGIVASRYLWVRMRVRKGRQAVYTELVRT